MVPPRVRHWGCGPEPAICDKCTRDAGLCSSPKPLGNQVLWVSKWSPWLSKIPQQTVAINNLPITFYLSIMKYRVDPCALVMSATICPPKTMIGSVRNDPIERMLEYKEAFRFYLALPDEYVDTLVIFENSGANLGVYRDIAVAANSKKQIHLINTSTNYPARMGKGYGEFMMIDEGLKKLLAAGISPQKKIWKVTGRLQILNIRKLISRASRNFEIYCDLRNVPLIGNALGGNPWMELRVFAFTMAGYDRYLRGNYDLGIGLETYFFDILYKATKSRDGAGVVPRFNLQPVINGFCGYNNKSYLNWEYRMKNLIRACGRIVFPKLWL